MKTIFVMRHSKAEQHFLASDFERKLTDIGKDYTLIVAQRFSVKHTTPTLFISSPAKRAKTTAQIFADVLGVHKDAILYKSELYHAPIFVYYQLLTQLSEAIESVVLFAHNPGITEFVNSLGIVALDNMPTSGIFGFTMQSATWQQLETAEKKFIYFDHPKHKTE